MTTAAIALVSLAAMILARSVPASSENASFDGARRVTLVALPREAVKAGKEDRSAVRLDRSGLLESAAVRLGACA